MALLEKLFTRPSSKPALPHIRLNEWDQGIFASQFVSASIFPRAIKSENRIVPPAGEDDAPCFKVGSFHGTQVAMTQTFHAIEQRFASFFDIANYESSVPQGMDVETRKNLYNFETRGYPPHLAAIPPGDKTPLLEIFNWMRLLDTGSLLGRVVPEEIDDFIHPRPEGATFAELEARNKWLRQWKIDVQKVPNIGDRDDWYSDAVFAQQQFTGTNPTTLTSASKEWISHFRKAAVSQNNERVVHLLDEAVKNAPDGENSDSLYVQDCSYFREAVGLGTKSDAEINSGVVEETCYLCATVSLFQLSRDGELHPIAIDIDYKSLDPSKDVVIFNKRLHYTDTKYSEKTDWPWRYAKTCAQISDWIRHEVTIHLGNTHFVEEVVIVAAHRAFPSDHPVYELLQPHWMKTLSLNASARSALIPQVIVPLVGCTEKQLYSFINDSYKRFDWKDLYIPTDLEKRGFPLNKLPDAKFHNYVYGKNMVLMWEVILHFVTAVLKTSYKSDGEVQNDGAIQDWITEMRGDDGGNMKSFPEKLNTISDLADAVTMCIHIASPQHTAVNYVQEYYQSFVVNKPPALCTPQPKTLEELNKYSEQDLLKSLPVDRPRQWLIASHVPYLLSYRVSEEQNLVNYAVSFTRNAIWKGDEDTRRDPSAEAEAQEVAEGKRKAGEKLISDLKLLDELFKANSDLMTDRTLPYTVMNPELTANSILL